MITHSADAYGAQDAASTRFVLVLFSRPRRATVAHARRRRHFDTRRPARPRRGIAFALRYRGKKRVHQADEYMAQIAAERIVEHLERARFVVMRKPALGGHSALGRGFDSR